MPTINPRETQKIELKTIKGGEVTCYTTFTAGDVEKITKADDGGFITSLLYIIKEWNLTDEDGKPLEVTKENIALLDIRDAKHIVEAAEVSIESFLDETPTESGSKAKQ